MYVVKIRAACLYHGTKSDCLDYTRAHGLNAAVIQYIAIPPRRATLNYWLSDLLAVCVVVTVITLLLKGLLLC